MQGYFTTEVHRRANIEFEHNNICISYNTGKNVLADVYPQCLRAQVSTYISGKAQVPVL